MPKTTRKPTKAAVVKVLDAVETFYKEDPKRFVRGMWARDVDGGAVAPKSPEACAWCLEGAIMKCAPDFPEDADRRTTTPLTEAVTQELRARQLKTYGGADARLFNTNDEGGLRAVRNLIRRTRLALTQKEV